MIKFVEEFIEKYCRVNPGSTIKLMDFKDDFNRRIRPNEPWGVDQIVLNFPNCEGCWVDNRNKRIVGLELLNDNTIRRVNEEMEKIVKAMEEKMAREKKRIRGLVIEEILDPGLKGESFTLKELKKAWGIVEPIAVEDNSGEAAAALGSVNIDPF